VTISNSVTTIGGNAFYECSSLTSVEFHGDAPESVGTRIFNNCNADLTIYYHEGTTGWTDSEYYDADAGTWCSRPLVMIEAPKPSYTITDVGRSLSLSGEIFINMYTKFDGFEGIDFATAGGLLVWNSTEAGEQTEETAVYGTQSYVQKGLVYANDTYGWGAQTQGLATKEYADKLYLRVYVEVADGEYIYGPLKEYSVQTYCQNQLNKTSTSDDVKQLCALMLHYGAAAQKAFNYNTGNLANANILDSYPAPDWMKT